MIVKAMYCDRCGASITTESYPEDPGREPTIFNGADMNVSIKNSMGGGGDEHYDLCPKCWGDIRYNIKYHRRETCN